MTEATSKPISRRTVAKGAAWTAPVILGGVAAPAYADSGPGPTITPGGNCKLPGNSCDPLKFGYLFAFTIQNTSSKPIYIYAGGTWPTYGPRITTVARDNKGALNLTYSGGYVGTTYYDEDDTIMVPAGGTVNFTLYAKSTNSADRVFGYTVDFQWGHTLNPDDDTEHVNDWVSASVEVAGTTPCVDCRIPSPGSTATNSLTRSSETGASAPSADSATATTSTSAAPQSSVTPQSTPSYTEPAPVPTTAP